MKAFTCDRYQLPLPGWHRFPIVKYARLRERIEQSGLIGPGDLLIPPAASNQQLSVVHDVDYLDKVIEGAMSPDEVRGMGFPWSRELVERSRRSVGATIAASRIALQEGIAVNLAGGTHHAFRDHAAGFCLFNDSAVAARVLQVEGQARRILIIDCDVHQGDGTASIFAEDSTVFTFSIHGAMNYPFQKQIGDLDIELADGTQDDSYLEALDVGLTMALDRAEADFALYLAGADPFLGDRLGRLRVSKEGLAARDRMVLHRCRSLNLPVALMMAGGYAQDIEDTVDIHFRTVAEAVSVAGSS